MHKREGDVDTVRNLERESERRVKQERERRKEFHGDSSRVSNRRERRKELHRDRQRESNGRGRRRECYTGTVPFERVMCTRRES